MLVPVPTQALPLALRPGTLPSDPLPSTIAFIRGRIARAALAARQCPPGLGNAAGAWYQGYDQEHLALRSAAGPTIASELVRYPTALTKRPWAFDAEGLRFLPEAWQKAAAIASASTPAGR